MLSTFSKAARSLARRPAYFLMSTGLLALGVGAVGAIFAVVDIALLRPLPYRDASRLEALKAFEPVAADSAVAYGLASPQLARWRAGTHQFEAIEGVSLRTITITGDGDPEPIRGMQVSAGAFSILGTSPVIGRAFTREEEVPASTVAIVSYDFWQQRLRGDPNVLSRDVTLDGTPRRIVGVLPAGFSVLFIPSAVYVPMPLDATQMKNTFRAIITIGDSLSLDVIAEGVETTEQRDALLKLGCQHFQGYLFGKPAPMDTP